MPAKTIETLAAKSLTIAKIHAEDLDKVRQTEDRLDKDLRRESRVPPYGRIQRIRFYGERFLHSKHVLLIVVILNVLDCLLVMGELIFDIFYIVFDSIIVVASFTLDLVFIKGITIYLIEDFVVILACLVPWRILRVVNSLVIAIIDHEHFRMKLLYIQKKHVSAQAKAMKAELKLYEESLLALEGLCKSKGITDDTLREHTGDLKNRKKNLTSSNSSQSVAFENSVVSMDSKP